MSSYPWHPLDPLKHSYAENAVEDELRNLLIAVFDSLVWAALRDENVLGMAHLGSEALIERVMQVDGLALPWRSDPLAYQYLYRAWKGRNSGRGTAFLQTVLQVFFPGEWNIAQMLQDKLEAYPTALSAWSATNDESAAYYLTSRLHIIVTAAAENAVTLATLEPILRAILPARFVPRFQVATTGLTALSVACTGAITMIVNTAGAAQPPRADSVNAVQRAVIVAPTVIVNTYGATT